DMIAAGVAAQVNAANAGAEDWTNLPTDGATVRPILKSTASLQPYYLAGLVKTITTSKGADVDAEIDTPKSRTYTPIKVGTTVVSVSYNDFLSAQIKAKIEAEVRANPALAGADEATIQSHINTAITANLSAQVTALSSEGSIYQGGLTIPNYLPLAEAGKQDAALGSWTASNDAAEALDLAGAPQDVNGSTNVTYRFPFAHKLGDVTIPVMVTLPATSKCGTKPTDGWPVAIYQHGITVDRTAGVLVGNALAQACVGMVAIDHVMHGVGPTSATGLVFNVDTKHKDAV